MTRRDFGQMLDNINADPTPPAQKQPTAPVQKPVKTPKPANQEAPVARSTPAPAPAPAAKTAGRAPSAGGVGIEELERKETRLHERQVVALAEQARRLNKLRGKDGHRITENTLIRLGVDLVLHRAADLHGVTEAELTASLKLT